MDVGRIGPGTWVKPQTAHGGIVIFPEGKLAQSETFELRGGTVRPPTVQHLSGLGESTARKGLWGALTGVFSSAFRKSGALEQLKLWEDKLEQQRTAPANGMRIRAELAMLREKADKLLADAAKWETRVHRALMADQPELAKQAAERSAALQLEATKTLETMHQADLQLVQGLPAAQASAQAAILAAQQVSQAMAPPQPPRPDLDVRELAENVKKPASGIKIEGGHVVLPGSRLKMRHSQA